MTFEFLLDPAAVRIDAIKRMADNLMDLLPDAMKKSMKPVSVVMKPATKMRKRSDGGVAYGFWTEKNRVISLWEDFEDYPVAMTLAHEAMHVIDDSWLTKKQRVDIMALMSPPPRRWNDKLIGSVRHPYIALPSEAFAVYASAAIVIDRRPAYKSMFLRKIHPDKLDALRLIIIRDDGDSGRVKESDDPVRIPSDTQDDLTERLATVQARLMKERRARRAAERAKAKVEKRLAEATIKLTDAGLL